MTYEVLTTVTIKIHHTESHGMKQYQCFSMSEDSSPPK